MPGAAAGEGGSIRIDEPGGAPRKAKAQVAELYRLIGSGEMAMDATLAADVKGLPRFGVGI